jgi:Spy/CpxP family protein refolding chaperone
VKNHKEKKMKKSLTVFSIFAIVFLFSVDSFAQYFQGRRMGRAHMNRSPSRILRVLKANQEELRITDDQLKAIEDLAYSFEEKMIDARSLASKQRLELQKLMQDRGDLDYAELKEALSKASEHKHNMLIEGVKMRDEIDKVLTPEQKEALKSMRQDRFKDRREAFRQDGRRGRTQRPPLYKRQIKGDF